jgi:gamma-glutamyltranspeptidase
LLFFSNSTYEIFLIVLGAIITADDLRNYTSIIRADDEIIYTNLSNGRHVCGPPPPSGAAVAQAILNILDG